MGFTRCIFSNLRSKLNFEHAQINIAKFNEKCMMNVCSIVFFCVNDFIFAVKIVFGLTLVKHVPTKTANFSEKCVFLPFLVNCSERFSKKKCEIRL